jgi:hypothetical protein
MTLNWGAGDCAGCGAGRDRQPQRLATPIVSEMVKIRENEIMWFGVATR